MSALSPWLESLEVAATAVATFWLGRRFSRLPAPYWMLGYFLPLGLIFLYCLAEFDPRVAVVPPISWMTLGRGKFVAFNVVATMLLSVPLARLTQKRLRILVGMLIVLLAAMSVLPFLAPAFDRRYLAGLKTRIDSDGVCLQSNDYTCGPAAAVTALRKLNLPAEEGQIAVLAHTSWLTGTDVDVLADELQKRYGPSGLVAEFRAFKDVDDLRKAGLTVVVLKFSAMEDHCVTVLGVETNRVIVADPLNGLRSVPVDEFARKWRYVGIALKRTIP